MAKAALKSRSADSSLQAIGSWAFLLGAVVAVITGAVSLDNTNPTIVFFLVLLGLIVGLLNVTIKEANSFLLASVSLVLVAGLGISVFQDVGPIGNIPLGSYLVSILTRILVFVVPATIVVALKSIFALAKNR